jgi:hypothetical protein
MKVFLHLLLLWPQRLFSWFVRARLAAFSLFVVILAVYISFSTGTEQALRLWGLALQLLGLAAAAVGIRDTRRMFGKPSFLQLLRNWVSSVPGLRPKTQTVNLSGSVSMTCSASATVWRGTRPGASVDERLTVAEENLIDVERRLRAAENSISDNDRAIATKLRQEAEERKEQDRQLDLRIESASTDGLHLAAAGAFWLGIGLILSTAPVELLRLVGNA